MPNKALPYLLLLPATLFLLVFFVYPFVEIALLAFTGPEGFTLQHIQTMATHWKFRPALGWTKSPWPSVFGYRGRRCARRCGKWPRPAWWSTATGAGYS